MKITVNGISVRLSDQGTLLDAIRQVGVSIPTLCHHPRLVSKAVCRMCLVEVKGQSQPKPACTTIACDGDDIQTDTPALQAFRALDLEWLLSRHPNDCMRCEVQGNCKLQKLVYELQVEEHWEKVPRAAVDGPHHLHDVSSPSIARDLSKCIECGLCVQACGDEGQQLHVIGFVDRGQERLPVTIFDKWLSDTPCISCGQCTLVCPTGALIEAPHWHDVLQVLDTRRRVSVVQVAPATRIAISEEFGMPPGTVSTGRMINALRRLGFDYVFDTNFAADLTIMEEGTELLSRVRGEGALPLLTSCCPGWVNWVEINRPDLIPNLSTTRSPQQMHGALTKRGPFARSLGRDAQGEWIDPYTVSVMPCTTKKDEAHRPGVRGDVDRVLTTRELARMMRARGISLQSENDDGVFDDPLGASTGSAQIFAASGGVMEAVARTASHWLGIEDSVPTDWQALRGVDSHVKSAQIPGVGKVAVCNGIAAAQRLLQSDEWRKEFVAIEVMACVGGCLGGGGEPKSEDPDILKKRAQAVYALDKKAVRRKSYENLAVQSLYEHDLGAPNSSQAHLLLHTSYSQRYSKRAVLMRFLDGIDRRDVNALEHLLHPEAVWSTASPLGEIVGRTKILEVISHHLPSHGYGPEKLRHRMHLPSSADDLKVVTPTGQLCQFELDVDISLDRPSNVRITRLAREVIE